MSQYEFEGRRPSIHPQACWASQVGEAAGIIGGEEAYRRAHRWLFEHQNGTIAMLCEHIAALRAADATGAAPNEKRAAEPVFERQPGPFGGRHGQGLRVRPVWRVGVPDVARVAGEKVHQAPSVVRRSCSESQRESASGPRGSRSGTS